MPEIVEYDPNVWTSPMSRARAGLCSFCLFLEPAETMIVTDGKARWALCDKHTKRALAKHSEEDNELKKLGKFSL